MQDQFTRDDVLKIVAQAMTLDQARVAFQAAERPFSVQKIQLDLGTAKDRSQAYRIGFPFKSLYAQDATDVNASVNVILGSNDQLQSPFSLKQNSAIDNGYPVNEAYIYWDAQAGKTMTLIAFVDASFRSGSQISVSGGGVSINDGTSVGAATRVTLGAAAAGVIVPQNTSRKCVLVTNNTGADLYFSGTSAVTNAGATRGVVIPSGYTYEFRNTGALYGYSVAGGDVNYVELT